jgi:TPR repeat protein
MADLACSAEHGRACRFVGWILQEHAPYQSADERAKNLTEAREYFTKACTLGDGGGCNNLGWFAINGWGGATDHALARKVFASACASDGGVACRHLGDMHAEGRGGPIDAQQATHFYLQALDTFARACEQGGEYCDFLAAGSTHWKLRTAEAKRILEELCLNHEKACFALAIYLDRTGDKTGAERWWGKECERENDDACLWLGNTLLTAGRPGDARKWLKQGCALSVASCFAFAEALREQKIRQETQDESVSVYAGACDRGHPHACAYGGSAEARERAKFLLSAECHAERSEDACESLRRLESLPARQAR